MSLLRVYAPGECGKDGYPQAWRECPTCKGQLRHREEMTGPQMVGQEPRGWLHICPDCQGATSIKGLIRELAGHRCVRCGHPYRTGEHGNGEWSSCDEGCEHEGPCRVLDEEGWRMPLWDCQNV